MATHCKTINTPIGFLKLISDEHRLNSILFVNGDHENSLILPDILEKAALQLHEYFEGLRFKFDLDLEIGGTSFQRKVWKLIKRVGYGKTKNYGEIARELKSKNFSRAVGMANGKNPLPIIIPCHRIIGNNGKLIGYSGGIEKKKWLLVHEQKYSGNSLFI
jgi:methylated-DNA-[protein]-cysteine S-methyltransferase